jgi:Sugar-transfer associated ATP-grasp
MNLRALTQIGFPFHPSNKSCGNPAMYRLRVAARIELYDKHPAWKRLAAKVLTTTLWPISAAKLAIQNGIDLRAPPSKMLDAWWLAMSHNVPPVEYFAYRLWEGDRRERLDDYLYWTECGPALAALNRASGLRSGPTPVQDKRLFSDFCAQLGLPTPTVYAVWEGGSVQGNNDLPRHDIWLKPTQSSGGTGAERWNLCGKEYRRHDDILTPDQMTAHIAEHSRSHRETLVQQVIRAHVEHEPLIGVAPLCARILTGRRRSGIVETLDAMAVWPRDGAEITQGGHIAMIDIGSGCLGEVFEASNAWPSRQMEGRILPNWSSVLDYVQRGHANLTDFAFLGWDVAFGREGPVLLETNSGWGSFHFQVVPDRPIADTAFASIAAEYL